MSDDPLKWLPDNEAGVITAILDLIEATIKDEELKEELTGMILITIDEWGKKKPQ